MAVSIPRSELRFQVSRSGGPGGQNVNKVNTRVTLQFDICASQTLSQAQKDRLGRKLSGRISSEGVLQVVSQRFRSQARNRLDAIDRLHRIVNDALKQKKARRATRVPESEKRRRLEEKARRSAVKRGRGRPEWD